MSVTSSCDEISSLRGGFKKQQTQKAPNIMAKFVCTHTMKGVTREQFSQVVAASQQDPTVKGLQSFANLTEGKIYCVWQAPQPEARFLAALEMTSEGSHC